MSKKSKFMTNENQKREEKKTVNYFLTFLKENNKFLS